MSFTIVVGDGPETWRDCHLEIDGTAFPAALWRDRPVVILGWWTESHLEMRRTARPARNSFMEGPFEFTVTPEDESLSIALFQRGRDQDTSLGEHAVTAGEYEHALVRAGASAARGAIPDKDLDALNRNLQALRRLLN